MPSTTSSSSCSSPFERRFPGVLLQWEDFASQNASPLLERYRPRLLSFNDDIQGTAAVTLAAIVGGLGHTGGSLPDQLVLIVGAGSAGTGIADMLEEALASDTGVRNADALTLIDRHGVLHGDRTDLADYQRPYVRPTAEVADLVDETDLAMVVERLRPTVMVGVSGQSGLFARVDSPSPKTC